MKSERDEGIESKYRTATVEENLKRFNLMLEGKHDEDKKEEEKKGADKKGGQKKGGPQGGNKGKKDDKPKEE